MAKVVAFCRFARANGFAGGVLQTVEAVKVAHAIEHEGADAVKFALRAVLCASREEWDSFDGLFEAFWNEPRPKAQPRREPGSSRVLMGLNGNQPGPPRDDGKAVSGASAYERLRKTDFAEVAPDDQDALEQIAQRLMKQTSLRLSRRLQNAEAPIRVDLRRTIRRSIGRGGDPLELRYKGRKPKQPRLVILLDVSGSMNLYSLFLLRFAHALQSHFRRTATFIFSTLLVDVSSALRSRDTSEALRSVSEVSRGWSGGTKIGESLHAFNTLHGRKLLSRDTLFIILSDGWDTGEPEALASELRTIRQKVRKLIWLNPLLGLEDYQPVTRGMAAALPHVDVFAPAHSLESLADLERHLTRHV